MHIYIYIEYILCITFSYTFYMSYIKDFCIDDKSISMFVFCAYMLSRV